MLLKDIRAYSGIYLACGATDLRKNVDGLSQIVKRDFEMDPFGNTLFLFCNRGRNRLKGLCWDRNGFWLCYKRLDGKGARFQWPENTTATREVKVEELKLLLSGMSVDPPRGFGVITARDF